MQQEQKRYTRIAKLRYNEKLTYQAIADIVGLSKQRVYQIIKEGGELSNAVRRKQKELDALNKEKKNGERARKIMELRYKNGLTMQVIGKRFGIKRARVSQIIKAENNKM